MKDFGMVVLGVLSVFSALGVIAAPGAVYSALFLTAHLMVIAILFLTLSAQFLAAAQLLIYAGAVMVVFLFAVTVLAPDEEPLYVLRDHWLRVGGLLMGAVLAGGLIQTFLSAGPFAGPGNLSEGTVESFAVQLFGRFLLPFEATAFLLLVALIAAVVLGRGRRPAIRTGVGETGEGGSHG
ncbi:MAG: NADH-quinone oxidoreductase subunit J [Armatimonadetes bacterium]|nr:NADH-quinone oxidoreductase subunit J [Armatimonadota bacterium]